MATLLEARDAVVTGLGAVKALKRVEPYHGELDSKELRRLGKVAPAVLVACLGVDRVNVRGGQVDARVRWGAFAVTSRAKPDLREQEALALVSVLLQVVPPSRWALDAMGRPEEVRAESLYSEDLDGQATAVWLVSWYQPLDLDPPVDLATLDDFLTFVSEHDLAPTDGVVDATDRVDLEAA